jgi:hypothetical protein
MNTRTARSQLMGGMIWGISSALHEVTEFDHRNARVVNRDLQDTTITGSDKHFLDQPQAQREAKIQPHTSPQHRQAEL